METGAGISLTMHMLSSDFLGSWINGNLTLSSGLERDPVCSWRLLTSSEVELMETSNVTPLGSFVTTASDFLGSWINGNQLIDIKSITLGLGLLTSSEVELMETASINRRGCRPLNLLTSSEVELMETLTLHSPATVVATLLTSSEVELMETFREWVFVACSDDFWLPRKLN